MHSVLDCKFDSKAVKGDGYVVDRNGRKRLRKTTAGVKLKVALRSGDKITETWLPLKDLKESNPVQVAEFAKARGLDKEPAFKWWVNHTLKKRDMIIASITTRLKRSTHKYGIEIPRNIEHAKEIDKKNGNTLWMDALGMEMDNVEVAFDIQEDGTPIPVGYKKASGHLVWDVKMDFTRKARWVKDGHKTADPEGSNFAGVVSRDSIRIVFTYAALNGLDICAADIKNAYIQAPTSEKHYIICGEEFGVHQGKVALIKRALYGGKSAGRDYWLHLRSCMEFLGFKSCKADPDVWIREAVRDDGTEYNEYVLLYVDDCLAVGLNPEKILRDEIGNTSN